MSKLCPKSTFCVSPIIIQHYLNPPMHGIDQSCTCCCWDLFHSSIMTSPSCWMLETWRISIFRLKMLHRCSIGFRSGDKLGESITFSFLSKAVVILAVCLGSLSCRSGQFLKGGHHVLLQNVTVHVGIHVFLNEAQLPSTSSTHAALDHDATTTMLDCRQDTIFNQASSHILDTI